MLASHEMKIPSGIFSKTDKEIRIVESNSVSCKGKEAPYDHPLIYLEIDPKIGHIECPYCSCKFELK